MLHALLHGALSQRGLPSTFTRSAAVLQGLWWLPTADDAAARSSGGVGDVLRGEAGGAELLRLVRARFWARMSCSKHRSFNCTQVVSYGDEGCVVVVPHGQQTRGWSYQAITLTQAQGQSLKGDETNVHPE